MLHPPVVMTVPGPIGPLNTLVRCSTDKTRASPTFVLVHGIQGTASAWSPVIKRLPSKANVFAPNLRGRGGSTVPQSAADYSLRGFAADLAAVIALADGPVIVVGWSMGVLIALTHAANPGNFPPLALGLIGGTACPADECRWFHGTTVDEIATEARARATSLGLTEYADPISVAGSWLAARDADLTPALGEIHIPTLVLHGDADEQCPPSHAERLAWGVPGATLRMCPGGGHNLPGQAPGFLARELNQFATRLAVSA